MRSSTCMAAAYCLLSPRSHRGLTARLAAASRATAYAIDYRLAPEHPYPAALDDAHAAYSGAAGGSRAGADRVAGDSAGGGLTLALAMRLRDEGDPLPAALALICPWLDPRAISTARARRCPTIPMQSLEDGRPGRARTCPAPTRHWRPTRRSRRSAATSAACRRSCCTGAATTSSPWTPTACSPRQQTSVSRSTTAASPASGTTCTCSRACFRRPRRRSRRWAAGSLADARPLASPARRDRRRRHVRPLHGRARCKHAGIDDFTIYEKADEVGGTWRENRYPGLTCDVPSRFYCYSFAPNPDWSSVVLSRSRDPGATSRALADELELRPHIRFGAEVIEARWEDGRWLLRTADGQSDEVPTCSSPPPACCTTRASPRSPAWRRSPGDAFHSARWDDDAELAGKRVGGHRHRIDRRADHHRAGRRGGAAGSLPAHGAVDPAGAQLASTRRWSAQALRRVPVAEQARYRYYQGQLEVILGDAVTRDGCIRKLISDLCRPEPAARGPRRRAAPAAHPRLPADVQAAGDVGRLLPGDSARRRRAGHRGDRAQSSRAESSPPTGAFTSST